MTSHPQDTLPSDVFFELVNQVLVEAGRRELEAVNRSIIRIEPVDRVLQILAGPGSGKTEMLVWRVLYELLVVGTPARRTMVTTFTRKAATELSVRLVERSDALLRHASERRLSVRDPRVHDLRVGTIHSLCDTLLAEFDAKYMEAGTQLIDEREATVRLLRSYRNDLGYTNSGKPARVLNRLIDCEHLTALFRAPWEENDRWPGNNMHRVQLIAALLGQHTETWIPRCRDRQTPNGAELLHEVPGLTDDLEKLRSRWSAYLTRNNIIDFTTLQLMFYERQQAMAEHLDHVLVDEFQDTNPIQFAIHTRWLTSPSLRLTVVGDDDQSMYRFRGADIDCFNEIKPFCKANRIKYRLEKLEKNWRSTKNVVRFAQAFKSCSVLARVSMPKQIVAGDGATLGDTVRLLRGDWDQLCEVVAREIEKRGSAVSGVDPNTALLFFSTSEKGGKRTGPTVATRLRSAIEQAGHRVYNARNKTAGRDGPVAELLGLLSYFIDPVSRAPVGVRDRPVEVSATDRSKASAARARPPPFAVSDAHVGFQKRFVKADGGAIGAPAGDRAKLIEYVDDIREELVRVCATGKPPRLTLAGLIARILSFPRYRKSGYTVQLFRQALFTDVLEANIAPTRLTRSSLDNPLRVEKQQGKYVWGDEYWTFLGTFGAMLDETDLDDPEVEAFEDGAVAMMTFHQSKGLEFDHVYIAATGRAVAPHAVLQTMLFSGQLPNYEVVNAQPESSDKNVNMLAEADRERELYVAMTRARKTLTFLIDPEDGHPLMGLNPVLEKLFAGARAKRYPGTAGVEILEYRP